MLLLHAGTGKPWGFWYSLISLQMPLNVSHLSLFQVSCHHKKSKLLLLLSIFLDMTEWGDFVNLCSRFWKERPFEQENLGKSSNKQGPKITWSGWLGVQSRYKSCLFSAFIWIGHFFLHHILQEHDNFQVGNVSIYQSRCTSYQQSQSTKCSVSCAKKQMTLLVSFEEIL